MHRLRSPALGTSASTTDNSLDPGVLHPRYTETSSNRIFVTVECLYGFAAAIPDGIKRIVKPA